MHIREKELQANPLSFKKGYNNLDLSFMNFIPLTWQLHLFSLLLRRVLHTLRVIGVLHLAGETNSTLCSANVPNTTTSTIVGRSTGAGTSRARSNGGGEAGW